MLKRVGLVVAAAVAALAVWVWWRVGHLDIEQLRPGVYALSGIGSNVGILVTDDGPVVVDTMTLVRQGHRILDAVHDLTPRPVAAVLNTHYHLDHTHGNPAFPSGTKVVATARTRRHLEERDADFWRDPPAHDLLPTTTFDTTEEIRVGDKTVRGYHLGRGHTDGDAVFLFVEDRVLCTGDLVTNGVYLNIDLEAGGSVREWAGTLDKVLALEFDTVIPGHGAITDRAGVKRFRDFVATLWSETKTIADRGGTLANATALVHLDGFGLRPLWWYPVLNRDFVIRRTWEEATGRPAS
jgi:cyclase